MSFKGIRSRLRNESLEGSPSRLSFFHQLSAALHTDDNQRLQQEVSNGHLMEEELLTLVIDCDNGNSIKYEHDSLMDTGSESQRRLLDVPMDRNDSPSPTDRDRDPLTTILRQARSGEERPTRLDSILETPLRHRFAGREKKRTDRSKSRERPGAVALAPVAVAVTAAPVTAASPSPPPPCVINSPQEAPSNNHTNGGDAATEEMNGSRQNRIKAWARKLVNDLQVIDETNGKDEESTSSHSLSMKRLKKNMVRFGHVTQPISTLSSNMQTLRQWESPTASLLLILVLFYVLWHDLCIPFVISVSIYTLTRNYLTTHGWWTNVADVESVDDDNDASGVTDRLAVLIQVARKVQNQLTSFCDAAEKIKNLLMWRHGASKQLYVMLWLALPVTLFASSAQLLTLAGFYLVLKLFVVDFIFLRFPRLRQKYDTVAQIWMELPTDADLDALRRRIEQPVAQGQNIIVDHRTFSESFNLPPTEIPIPGWQNGLRSTLVNRDKSLTSAFKTGRLFLTANYLCFERSKSHPEKNVVIPLDRIVRLEKGNQYSWIPGGGMIIEVFTQGLDRAYIFGAIMNRDEVFIAIREAAEKKGFVWREEVNL